MTSCEWTRTHQQLFRVIWMLILVSA